MGEVLAPHGFDAIVSSSSRRAQQTAELVSAATGVPIAHVDDRLLEHDVPRWTGLTREEIETIDPGVMDRWRNGSQFDLPGAEAWSGFEQRVRDGLMDAADHGTTVLVVAHAGVLRAIHTGIGGLDSKVSRRKGQWLHVAQQRLTVGGLERIVRTPT